MIRALLLLAALAACSSDPPTRTIVGDRLKPRARCPVPALPAGEFTHTRSSLMSRAMTARHAASDVVVAAGEPFTVGGKLTYGPSSKDLEDEEVALWIEDGATCAAREIARGRTDSDGRVVLTAPAREPGTYQLWLAVVGDTTTADATAYVVARGQPAVLFDVDGTLTTSDAELFEDLAGGEPAAMFPDADAVARHWAERGHLVIYLTGRPYLLRAHTRAWLDANSLPPGPLITTDTFRQAVPSEGGVGAFKRAAIERLLATGIDTVRAYGNAATDVCAYARAGIAPDRTFIVGPDARRCDDHPPSMPLRSYTEHLRELGSRQDAR